MNPKRLFLWLLAGVGVFRCSIRRTNPIRARSRSRWPLLEQGHYSRRKLDDSFQLLLTITSSARLQSSFLTQKTSRNSTQIQTTLDDDILLGAPEPAFAIFSIYKKRVDERVAKAKELLKQKYEFNSDRTVEINRQKAPWPKDDAEAEQIWRDRVENELLQEALAKTSTKDPVERLTKRYDQLQRTIREQTREDINKTFLSYSRRRTIAQRISEPVRAGKLQHQQRLSLVGIGAVLHSEEGYAKIMELVPGGLLRRTAAESWRPRLGCVRGRQDLSIPSIEARQSRRNDPGKKDTIVRLQVIR